MKATAIAAILIAVCAFNAPAAAADSLALPMDVSATVVANCRITVPPLSFGSYDPLVSNANTPADASTVIIVACTRSIGTTVVFDVGHHPVASDRGMAGPGSELLRYQIYRDSARSQIWGQGADAMRVVSTGVGNPQQLTVFGRIPPRQEVAPGSYADVLTATVDF